MDETGQPSGISERASPSSDGAIPFLTPGLTVFFAALVVLVLLIGNATTSLWDQDEAAYAGFARTMIRTGDWVVPQFTWSEPHRKTPLLFWCIAVSFMVFGENEFALRFPTVLAVLLTFVSIATIGRSVFGKRVACLAAAILAATLFIPNLGKIAVTDSLVMLFETLAALALMRIVADRPEAKRVWPWTLLFWVSVALGTLAKGPVILIFCGGMGAWLTVFHAQRVRLLLGLQPWFLLPLSLVPIWWWGSLAWERTDGELIRWMYDWYVKNRATRTVFNQGGPPGYYLITFFWTLLPWACFIPAALVRVWQRRKEPVYCALAGWLAAGWVVWEFAASKLPTYALGAYPAFALLFAYEVLDLDAVALWKRRSVRIGVWLSLVTSFVFATGILGGAVFFLHEPRLAFAAALPAAIILVVPMWAMARLRSDHGDIRSAVRLLLFGPVTCLLSAWILTIPQMEPMRSQSPQIAKVIEAEAPAGAAVMLGGNFSRPSLPFYLGRNHDPILMKEASVADMLQRADGEPSVLVLNEEGYADIQQSRGARDWRSIHVPGFNFDRGHRCEFWVFVRNAPAAQARNVGAKIAQK